MRVHCVWESLTQHKLYYIRLPDLTILNCIFRIFILDLLPRNVCRVADSRNTERQRKIAKNTVFESNEKLFQNGICNYICIRSSVNDIDVTIWVQLFVYVLHPTLSNSSPSHSHSIKTLSSLVPYISINDDWKLSLQIEFISN